MRQPSIANLAEWQRSVGSGLSKTIRACMSGFILKVRSVRFVTRIHFFPVSSQYFQSPFSNFYRESPEAINASLSTLSIDAQKRAQKDAAKKEAKAAASEAREAEAKKAAVVYVKRVERNKRKFVTAVSGLEAHGLDLKKVAKEFGKKCE